MNNTCKRAGKTGASGLAAEGKERYAEFNKDKADGKINYGQELKDASKDWRVRAQACYPSQEYDAT